MQKDNHFSVSYERDENGVQNPLSSTVNCADPCIVFNDKDGYYYGICTGNTFLTMYRAKRIQDLFDRGESKVVYEAKDEDETYGYLWAPELHFLQGHWYLYTSTHQTRENKGFKHVICLKAKSDDLFDGFELAAHINKNLFAIDPTVYQNKQTGELHICFSAVLDGEQKLCIQKMLSPTEPVGNYTVIAKAELDWELVPLNDIHRIVEGAYFVQSGERLFIVYSANGCWNDDYVFGILEFTGGDMLDAKNWEKSKTPLMTKGNGNYGPGHATFFYSPDKTELWMCHHCLDASNPKQTPMTRRVHVQKVLFDKTGFPHLGLPVPKGIKLKQPSQ